MGDIDRRVPIQALIPCINSNEGQAPITTKGDIMAYKIPPRITKELYRSIVRLEHATELIKSLVNYMDGDLSPSEELLVKECKDFLGVKDD